MGKFIELKNDDIVKYEALTDKPFEKVFALQNILKFYKFAFAGTVRSSEIFYDTPNDLLYKAGVVLSRVQEDDRVFFKVAPSASLTNINTQKIFSHKVGIKDTLKDHAFYLVDGIKGLFYTPFSIDVENVIKNAVPKIGVFTNANVYKVISGTGFRAFMCHEETKYENYETKRKHRSLGMTIKMLGPAQYASEFVSFNNTIKKYCKEFIEIHDNTYEHAKKITRKIDAKQAKKDKKQAKLKFQELKSQKDE